MEIKAQLLKPYTKSQKLDFIVDCNEKNLIIEETETALIALGKTEEELEQEEKERIAMLSLTRGDVFRGLLQAKQITRAQIRAMIENNETLSILEKEMALIDFDEALNFYRGNALINVVGQALGITSEQLDKFFETNDYTVLLPPVEEETTTEENSTVEEEISGEQAS